VTGRGEDQRVDATGGDLQRKGEQRLDLVVALAAGLVTAAFLAVVALVLTAANAA